MKNIFEQLIILTKFMTRILIPIKVNYDPKKLGKSIKFFPLVGLAIGLILYYSSIILVKFSKNNLINALIVIVIELMVVGIIHIDGLCDTFDGLFSYREKEKMLEIMKDSRIGTNGAIILVLYFIAKILFISEIFSINLKYLIIYPVLARLATPVNAAFSDYARKNGMSNFIILQNSAFEGIFSIILAAALSFLILSFKGFELFLGAFLFIIFFMQFVKKKIDGVTGDTMGAALELTTIFVLFLAIFLKWEKGKNYDRVIIY